MATIALGLLAHSLAGADAGAVLGTALAIKMIAYVGLAPIGAAITERLPRRATLVALDIVRAAVVLLLPFVSEVWQIYVLIFLLQAASACYTPAFQALIPEVLSDERQYTRALSLSRLAYDLENVASPLLAAALLTVITFSNLFVGTMIGFVAAALLVLSVDLPVARPSGAQGFYQRTTRGLSIYFKTPRLRGLTALTLAMSAGCSMVLVNTVVIVQSVYGLDEHATAIAYAAYGAGSMSAALMLPGLLERLADRKVMVAGTVVVTVCTFLGSVLPGYPAMLALWLVIGMGFAAVSTPVGRLVRRSSRPEDRTALFAAQFAVGHSAYLINYPLAGWLGATAGLQAAFLVMTGVSIIGLFAALWLWPVGDADELDHVHDDLSATDPHLTGAVRVSGGYRHRHAFVIDTSHRAWPARK